MIETYNYTSGRLENYLVFIENKESTKMSDKYLLFNLEDDKSKKLGEVISSSTCKKICNFLTEKEASESEIAKELKLPLNTIDYNIKKLLEAGIVEKSKSWWSVKGKKIETYKVANKLIVISPKKSNIYNKLKTVIPVFLVSVVFTLLFFFNKAGTARFVSQDSSKLAASLESASQILSNTQNVSSFNPYFWIIGGIWILILAFIIWSVAKR